MEMKIAYIKYGDVKIHFFVRDNVGIGQVPTTI